MLVEGSYWYNEAYASGVMSNYVQHHPGEDYKERGVAFMALPVQMSGTVTEGKGRKQTLVEGGFHQIAVNSKVASDSATMEAIRKLIQELYTDEECKRSTLATGLKRSMDYPITEDDVKTMARYHREAFDMVAKSDIFYNVSMNPLYNKVGKTLRLVKSAPICRSVVNNAPYDNYLSGLRDKQDLQAMYESSYIDHETWLTMIK